MEIRTNICLMSISSLFQVLITIWSYTFARLYTQVCVRRMDFLLWLISVYISVFMSVFLALYFMYLSFGWINISIFPQQNRSRTKYLIPTYTVHVLLLDSNLILKSSLTDGFSIRFSDNSEVAFFLLGHPIYIFAQSWNDSYFMIEGRTFKKFWKPCF